MPRVAQALVFFGILGAELLVTVPHESSAGSFGALLSGAVIAATVAYILPWVFTLDTTPAVPPEDG